MKKAFITGIGGQDGSYLAEYLLKLGYEVHGCVRRSSVSENQTYRINNILDKINMHHADITDFGSICALFKEIRPDEIYHLAAMSHVKVSFLEPELTLKTNTLGTLNILNAAKLFCPEARIYNASSSEMFGNEVSWILKHISDYNGPNKKHILANDLGEYTEYYQDEYTEMIPVSPYGISKLAAHNLCLQYKEQGMFVSSGILFNHESPRRASAFVSKKIVKGAVDILFKRRNELVLGNLESSRDWGYAEEYVVAMHMMLQDNKPGNYVIATGTTHTIREACEYVFNKLSLDINLIKYSDKYTRPIEVNYLRGDMRLFYDKFKWKPTTTFEELFDIMIKDELTKIK